MWVLRVLWIFQSNLIPFHSNVSFVFNLRKFRLKLVVSTKLPSTQKINSFVSSTYFSATIKVSITGHIPSHDRKGLITDWFAGPASLIVYFCRFARIFIAGTPHWFYCAGRMIKSPDDLSTKCTDTFRFGHRWTTRDGKIRNWFSWIFRAAWNFPRTRDIEFDGIRKGSNGLEVIIESTWFRVESVSNIHSKRTAFL